QYRDLQPAELDAQVQAKLDRLVREMATAQEANASTESLTVEPVIVDEDWAEAGPDDVMLDGEMLSESIVDEQFEQSDIVEESVREASASLDEISPEADMAQMMARMAEIGTTGIEHERLQPMLGTFNATVRYWMMPGGEPTLSTGTMKNTWILGGRFLQGDYSGSFEGMPFVGLSLTGYDKVRGKYVGSWVDSSSTAMANISTGEMSKDGRTITFYRNSPDCMTGKDTDSKEVLEIIDANTHRMSMWGPAPDGTWFKMMVIDYSRAR
ncbi:MAG: DUF1579 domain-containing protein, partial [Planctomycetota bacterium]